MKTSAAGFDFIRHFEGLYLSAYRCPAGVWTIGYGHTGLQHRDGTVYSGRTITKAEAERLLAYDLQQFEARVNTFVTVPLSQTQFDALVSFDFNTGGLRSSTLLRKLNRGDYDGAAEQFLLWDKVTKNGKKVRVAGLTRRRKSEKRLFENLPPFIVK